MQTPTHFRGRITRTSNLEGDAMADIFIFCVKGLTKVCETSYQVKVVHG